MTDKEKHILRKSLASLEKTKLIDLILHQAERLDKLDEVEKEVSRLRSELTTALRANKRQAAPFGKKKGKEKPKRPGRKKGHKGYYRQPSHQADEAHEVALDNCPHCGGQVEQVRPLDQIIEELPVVQPRVVRLRTYRGHCADCGSVHSTHPLQVGHATGSAQVQLGPGSISWILQLRHRYGLSVHKTCQLLQEMFQLKLSPGAVCHLEQRIAKKLLPDYEQLLQQARQAHCIHADETSWYVGAPGHWLWVVTNEDLTLYEVADQRSGAVIEQLLGTAFDGILVSDCASVYENFCAKQQKCYAHHLKAIKDALQAYPQSSYLKLLRRLLRKAIGYEACRKVLKPPDYKVLCDYLEQRADQLLPTYLDENGKSIFDQEKCPFQLQEVELKVARRIAKRRQHLLTFLYHQEVPATNNLAERQLRPAVIQRKISCGNKTERGAQAWKINRSILVTDIQRGTNFSDSICQALKRDLCRR